jgi:sugar phosphate isomerase/epimerase
MPHHRLPRRAFLTAAAAAAAAPALGVPARAGAREPAAAGAPATLRLGVASYSLREFPRARAIEMIRALGTPWVNVKSVHLPYELAPAALAAGRREFEAAGLTIVGGGTITFEEDTDEAVGRYFAYARAAGMPLVVATAHPRILPRLERFARRTGIAVAIHNHGPEDPHYPSPYDVLRHVRDMDPRMGLCVDVGHTVRAGTDVVRALADAGPRVLDLHVKDLRDQRDAESQVAVGAGSIPIAAIFRQLLAMDFRGNVNLEYEIDARDPLPGMQRSFAFMRGVLAGLGAGGSGNDGAAGRGR